MKRRKFNESQLAVEFGIDRRALAQRLEDVEPCEVTTGKNGKESRWYWMREAAPAILGVDLSAKQKLEILKVRELELDIAEREGDLVQFSAQQSANAMLAAELHAAIDGFAHGAAHECAGKTAEEVVGVLQSHLDSFRAVIAQIRVPIPDVSGADQGAQLNGHRVV